jgi:NAD(P)H-flavin reductase/NADPH-dependent glutamate synthase beta subunit-like oxidoreductase
MSQTTPTMPLGIEGFSYADLHAPARLRDLHELFCQEVAAADPALWSEWDVYRVAPDAERSPLEVSDLIVRMAPHVSRFVAKLFGVEGVAAGLVAGTTALDPLFRFKIDFVRKRALPLVKNAEKSGSHLVVTPGDVAAVDRLVLPWAQMDREMAIAHAGCALLDAETAARDGGSEDDKARVAADIESLRRWCAHALHDPDYREWVVFRFAETIDYFDLVQVQRPRPELPEAMLGPDRRLRRRDGFALTDARWRPREVVSEIHYCVLCHERDKDSCSKGLRDKQGAVTANPLGIPLPGCPLDEKISEMHMLRKAGDAIGSLAIIMIDNPLVPGTGHRICNDCMKACIYQKQEPVNIPQIETGVLTDVLRMPWGVEIYGFLTRWNPLNVRCPYALPYNGRNVLVVGLGPAGYTLAHYLLNEGFGVVAIDGLKIEPLPAEWTGERSPGDAGAAFRRPIQPIERWDDIYRPLDERVLEGFGGVSEYGITVRWDKNFLTLLHLTLARRQRLRIYGGVRFGGTMPIEDAWGYGFDHIAIAAGAGRPTVIDMKNNLVRGVRKASDFLMALQLTGAFKRGALPNLQARLPAIVIGGGLTGIDTATELFSYYPVQVEKVLERFETLCAGIGEATVRGAYDPEEFGILDEFLEHGRAVRAERARATAAGEPPDFVPLVRAWGGVTLAYRKRMVDSPAYRLNHEEVVKALEEGIWFAENLDPKEIVADERDHARALVFKGPNGPVEMPARTILVAAGTSPNVTYEKELPGTFQLDGKKRFFQGFRAERTADGITLVPDPAGFFTSHNHGGRLISYYGDNHPRYAGNVVKAMASAKDGYRHIVALFAADTVGAGENSAAGANGVGAAVRRPEPQAKRDAAWDALVGRLDDELLARVERVERLTETIIEVVVRAPAAARHFRPGQFYRLQNFEALATRAEGDTPLLMEGIALTGAWMDPEKGLLSLIALEMGVSSRLCAYLKPGEAVVVMGPTGTPTEIPRGESVLLAGGGLGNAVLFSIARALRENGNKVLYFAGYKKGEDVFKREEIEASTDQVIWSSDMGAEIAAGRPQDTHFRGNIVQAMIAYGKGELTTPLVALSDITRIIAIGSDRMMAAVKAARHTTLAPFIRKDHVGIASINSPMQCMMKEICAQCLQKHVDPVTGKEEFIFSCFNQDQEMDRVDFPNLNARLRQNTVQEKLSNLWLDHLLESVDLPHI